MSLPAQVKPELPQNGSQASGPHVLFVDLDGSLVASNLMIESFFDAIRSDWTVLFKAPRWLLEGRSVLKSRLSEMGSVDASSLPYREEVLAVLKELRLADCRLVLATASNRVLADLVAAELDLFDDVLASDEACNLKGKNKLRAIEAYCKEHGFEQFAYLGDSNADLAIWSKSAHAFAVAPSPRFSRRLGQLQVPVEIIHAGPAQPWKLQLKALRPHQWLKNLLVFLPVFLAHDLSPIHWLLALVAFVSMSACASSIYLLNDLYDLRADRRHPTKKRRPFASGRVALETGLAAVPVLASLGLGLSLLTGGWRFPLLMIVYLATSALYCFWLKRVALVDVFLLSGLYMLRVQAGGSAAGVAVSEWLLIFSLFFFLSLAFAKRVVELDRLEMAADVHETGRGYRTIDLASLYTMGAVSGFSAVLVLALYINSPQVSLLYVRPKILSFLCPILLYWISRVWLLARRNELHDDPVVFAVKDRVSQGLGVLCVLVVLTAWLLGK